MSSTAPEQRHWPPPPTLSFHGGVASVETIVSGVGLGPRCFLLRLGGASVLLDAGCPEGLDARSLRRVARAAGHVDCVLLTEGSLASCGALPALYAAGMRVPVFASVPAARLGQLACYDAYVSHGGDPSSLDFALDDVDAAFSSVVPVRDGEPVLWRPGDPFAPGVSRVAGREALGLGEKQRKTGDELPTPQPDPEDATGGLDPSLAVELTERTPEGVLVVPSGPAGRARKRREAAEGRGGDGGEGASDGSAGARRGPAHAAGLLADRSNFVDPVDGRAGDAGGVARGGAGSASAPGELPVFVLTPRQCGSGLGSVSWVVSLAGEDVLYAPLFDHARSATLDGAHPADWSLRPALAIVSARGAAVRRPPGPPEKPGFENGISGAGAGPSNGASTSAAGPSTPPPSSVVFAPPPPPRAAAEWALVDRVLTTLRAGGDALVACESGAGMLALAVVLDRAWARHRLPYPLVVASPTAKHALDAARTAVEWCSDTAGRALGKRIQMRGRDREARGVGGSRRDAGAAPTITSDGNPHALPLVAAVASADAARAVAPRGGPRLVLAPTACLVDGPSREALARLFDDPQSVILLPHASLWQGVLGTDRAQSDANANAQDRNANGHAPRGVRSNGAGSSWGSSDDDDDAAGDDSTGRGSERREGLAGSWLDGLERSPEDAWGSEDDEDDDEDDDDENDENDDGIDVGRGEDVRAHNDGPGALQPQVPGNASHRPPTDAAAVRSAVPASSVPFSPAPLAPLLALAGRGSDVAVETWRRIPLSGEALVEAQKKRREALKKRARRVSRDQRRGVDDEHRRAGGRGRAEASTADERGSGEGPHAAARDSRGGSGAGTSASSTAAALAAALRRDVSSIAQVDAEGAKAARDELAMAAAAAAAASAAARLAPSAPCGRAPVLLDGFEPPKGAEHPMFPDELAQPIGVDGLPEDPAAGFDAYGGPVPAGFLAASIAENDDEPDGASQDGPQGDARRPDAAGARSLCEDGQLDEIEALASDPLAFSAAETRTRTGVLRATVLPSPVPRCSDPSSVAVLVAEMAPRSVALIDASQEDVQAMADRLGAELAVEGPRDAGSAPILDASKLGAHVEARLEPSYVASVDEELVRTVHVRAVKDTRLGWLDGRIVGDPDGTDDAADARERNALGLPPPLPRIPGNAPSLAPLPTLIADRAGMGGAGDDEAGDDPARSGGGVLVGDVRLSELRAALAAKGVASEFAFGALWCEGPVVIRRDEEGDGGLSVEGDAGEAFDRIREIIRGMYHVC